MIGFRKLCMENSTIEVDSGRPAMIVSRPTALTPMSSLSHRASSA
jgi:hypothetical protein